MKNKKRYQKPSRFWFRTLQFLTWVLSKTTFKTEILRNELKHHKDGCVVLFNHECALDFVDILRLSRKIPTLVMSQAFCRTLPAQKIVEKFRFIVKQQFQTTYTDLVSMKSVTNEGENLYIFPAGLMPENGISTPMPEATTKLLKFLGTDVFVGRISGTYFVNAKWRKGFRKGKTFVDCYKLISKEELASLSLDEIKNRLDEALTFDAYDEQEKLQVKYKNNDDINGLEKVLYKCPHCHKEGSMIVKNNNTIKCAECGYEETCDELGFLHQNNKEHEEFRHVSMWDLRIYEELKQEILDNPNFELSSNVELFMINNEKHKFLKVGEGLLKLNKDTYKYSGTKDGGPFELEESSKIFYILPSSPIRNSLEFQKEDRIYRVVFKSENQFVVKWLHALKIFYEINTGINTKVYPKEARK